MIGVGVVISIFEQPYKRTNLNEFKGKKRVWKKVKLTETLPDRSHVQIINSYEVVFTEEKDKQLAQRMAAAERFQCERIEVPILRIEQKPFYDTVIGQIQYGGRVLAGLALAKFGLPPQREQTARLIRTA